MQASPGSASRGSATNPLRIGRCALSCAPGGASKVDRPKCEFVDLTFGPASIREATYPAQPVVEKGSGLSQRLAFENDLPGSRRAPCLGCGGLVVTARDPHCLIGGRRDGSLLVVMDAEPLISWATDVDRIYQDPDIYLLGVAHRDCVPVARLRLETGQVELPDELPQLLVDEETGPLPALHRPPQFDVCPFCGAADATDEHVFPKWVSRELNKHAPLQGNTDFGPRRINRLEFVAPVCEKCNTRWLSVVENDVQTILAPLIRGYERTLTADQQTRLATWAVKTAFMLDLASGTPFIPTGFYHELRQQRTALSSHLVWLGAYNGARRAIWAEHHPLRIAIGADEEPNGFVTTFIVFRCLFQVVGHFTRGEATLKDARLFARGLWPIAPACRQPIAWPRDRLAFNDDELVALASSIDG
jgi:hypothetical protein